MVYVKIVRLTARQTDLIRQMARGAKLYYGYGPYLEYPRGVGRAFGVLDPVGHTVNSLQERGLIEFTGFRGEAAGFQRDDRGYALTDLGKLAADDILAEEAAVRAAQERANAERRASSPHLQRHRPNRLPSGHYTNDTSGSSSGGRQAQAATPRV